MHGMQHSFVYILGFYLNVRLHINPFLEGFHVGKFLQLNACPDIPSSQNSAQDHSNTNH